MTPDVRFSTEIGNRYQFGALCDRRGLLGTAVELGVHRGTFAGHFLAGWGGQRYFAVDHYLPHFVVEGNFAAADNYRARDIDEQIAHANLLRFGDRVQWRKLDTVHALQEHAEASLDFAYLDADHTYWAVAQEIAAAWPRIKPGGILAGHDFFHGTPDVMRAVKEFAAREQLTCWLTMDEFCPWSWYFEKPAKALPCES